MDSESQADENTLVTTVLVGREAKDIVADFVFTEDGQRLIQCPAGYSPKSCNYIRQTGQCRLSFPRSKCENCPHCDRCNPKFFNKTSVLFLSKKSSDRAKNQRQMKTEYYGSD